MHGNESLELKNSKLFNLFLKKSGGTDSANFRGDCMENIVIVEDINRAGIPLNDFDIVDRSMIGELEGNVGKHSNTEQLLRSNSHICYVLNINTLFKTYRCPSCDEFIKTSLNLEPGAAFDYLQKNVKHGFSKNVHQLRETPIDKLDSFNTLYSDEQKLF